jgi:hypothetical protein
MSLILCRIILMPKACMESNFLTMIYFQQYMECFQQYMECWATDYKSGHPNPCSKVIQNILNLGFLHSEICDLHANSHCITIRFDPPAKHCNGEESHYKGQPNKSSNGLLHMPLHCNLITITLPLPVLSQTLSGGAARTILILSSYGFLKYTC